MKLTVCRPLPNILHNNIYSKGIVYVNELILILFSPFDIKCKKFKLMLKASRNVFLGDLGE